MKDEFIQAGFAVVGNEASDNKLVQFLKENYPSVIKDNELDLNELKTIAGLPFDEKVNGYGLNFVGRHFARAKYAQKTTKELKLNTKLSKNIESTGNLVLKGDNLDSLKILKNYYTGKIKCIYIDPPYNTASDEFVYPDKFDKEETEVLGFANLSDDDFARLDFSFKTKKSHNGWLSFMYPRLLLARDLLREDGVIFISIDDNEQANLKLLCDDVFGEENFIAEFVWKKKQGGGNDSSLVIIEHEYLLCFCKSKKSAYFNLDPKYELDDKAYPFSDDQGDYGLITLDKSSLGYIASLDFEIKDKAGNSYYPRNENGEKKFRWRWGKEKVKKEYDKLIFKNGKVYTKYYRPEGITPKSLLVDSCYGRTASGNDDIKFLFGINPFNYPKPIALITHLIRISTSSNDIILDFFAGSGTTGQAVMQLNEEDGGMRTFILCQLDEPIKEDKPAYKFCVDNDLPPVISSITIERLRRTGEKIAKELENTSSESNLFEKKTTGKCDIGFKVFDSIEEPKLEVDKKGQISIVSNENDTLSRIYNMIFTVGLDAPTQVPEEVVTDCIYRIGENYYLTNSEKINMDAYANVIRNAFGNSAKGQVFIDGWTASINETLQSYKEDVKIVF